MRTFRSLCSKVAQGLKNGAPSEDRSVLVLLSIRVISDSALYSIYGWGLRDHVPLSRLTGILPCSHLVPAQGSKSQLLYHQLHVRTRKTTKLLSGGTIRGAVTLICLLKWSDDNGGQASACKECVTRL